MLNYLNICVYFPKMAPLNWGNRVVWGVWGIWGVSGGVWCYRGEMKAPNMGICTKEVIHAPTIMVVEGGKVGCKAQLFKLKSWCVLQDLVQNVFELIFTQHSCHVQLRYFIQTWSAEYFLLNHQFTLAYKVKCQLQPTSCLNWLLMIIHF